MIDADSAKWRSMAETTRAPLGWIYRREARLLGRFEAEVMRKAFATLVVNEKERAELLALAPDAPVLVVENGVDLTSFAPEGADAREPIVVFCGVMNYQPNVQGARWLVHDVWPIVRASRPDARLMLIGASPSAEVVALASQEAGVVVTGTVPDVRPYLWRAAVATAPLLVARGIQNKVLEAVAAGLPCVVTPQVADGLPREVGPACRTGAGAEGFAEALIDLLAQPQDVRSLMAAAADLGPLQWAARLSAVAPLLDRAVSTGRHRQSVRS
jgi:glycosyltransferase involved in cell wall biosynthesis